MREKLIEILSVPIHPHELADPTEVVADYLLNNDVIPVTRCKDCKYHKDTSVKEYEHCCLTGKTVMDNDYCSYGENKFDDLSL